MKFGLELVYFFAEFVQVLCSDGKSKGAKKKKKHRKKEEEVATDDLTTTTTAEVVVEDDAASRNVVDKRSNVVDKRSNVMSSKSSSGPSNISSVALPLKSGLNKKQDRFKRGKHAFGIKTWCC